MKLPDRRLNPPPEPAEVGTCCGCGDAILADEKYAIFESGKLIHQHSDCKVAFTDSMLGQAEARLARTEQMMKEAAKERTMSSSGPCEVSGGSMMG